MRGSSVATRSPFVNSKRFLKQVSQILHALSKSLKKSLCKTAQARPAMPKLRTIIPSRISFSYNAVQTTTRRRGQEAMLVTDNDRTSIGREAIETGKMLREEGSKEEMRTEGGPGIEEEQYNGHTGVGIDTVRGGDRATRVVLSRGGWGIAEQRRSLAIADIVFASCSQCTRSVLSFHLEIAGGAHTEETRATENDDPFALALIFSLEVDILHAAHGDERRDEHDHGQPVQVLLHVDVRAVDRESHWRVGRERKGVGQRREYLGNEGVLRGFEVGA